MDISSLHPLIPLSWLKDNIVTASNISTTSEKSFSEFLLLKSFLRLCSGPAVKNMPAKARPQAPPRFRKIPHSEEQLSQGTTRAEPMRPTARVALRSKRSRREKPARCNCRVGQRTATRESPSTAVKTQHSQYNEINK